MRHAGEPERRSAKGAFSILTVCTANLCRSPAAERLLGSQLGPGVTVSSAGTHARVGELIPEPMADLLAGSGVASQGFAARRLSPQLVQHADLVLPMARAHRRLVVQLWPAAVRRTFTLREFARLLSQVDPAALSGGSPADRLAAAIPLAAAQRGRKRTSWDDDDVVDPFGLSAQVYAESFAQITSAVAIIVRCVGSGGFSTTDGSEQWK